MSDILIGLTSLRSAVPEALASDRPKDLNRLVQAKPGFLLSRFLFIYRFEGL